MEILLCLNTQRVIARAFLPKSVSEKYLCADILQRLQVEVTA